MSISQINKEVIERINNGSEKAFSDLYKAYYSYLNAITVYYLPNGDAGREIVNDVFINMWDKKESLSFPIHSYLVRSVQNGCLNYIRTQRAQQNVLDEHKEQLLLLQEDYVLSTPAPLQYVEMHETEAEIRQAVNLLPPKCRLVFEEYFYNGKPVPYIAQEMDLTISTVRVQLKNAMDRLKVALKHLVLLFW